MMSVSLSKSTQNTLLRLSFSILHTKSVNDTDVIQRWSVAVLLIERLGDENEDKTKIHDWIDLGYFDAKS